MFSIAYSEADRFNSDEVKQFWREVQRDVAKLSYTFVTHQPMTDLDEMVEQADDESNEDEDPADVGGQQSSLLEFLETPTTSSDESKMKQINVYSWTNPCWKCKEETPRLIAVLDEEYSLTFDAPDELGTMLADRFPYYRYGYSKTLQSNCWANWCTHCDILALTSRF